MREPSGKPKNQLTKVNQEFIISSQNYCMVLPRLPKQYLSLLSAVSIWCQGIQEYHRSLKQPSLAKSPPTNTGPFSRNCTSLSTILAPLIM